MGDCPSERPVRLPAMPAEPFTAAGVAKLRRALDTLGRPRTAAEVRSVTAQSSRYPRRWPQDATAESFPC